MLRKKIQKKSDKIVEESCWERSAKMTFQKLGKNKQKKLKKDKERREGRGRRVVQGTY